MEESANNKISDFFKNQKNLTTATSVSSLILFFAVYSVEFLSLWNSFFFQTAIYTLSFLALFFSIFLRVFQYKEFFKKRLFIKSVLLELLLLIPPAVTINDPILFSALFSIRQIYMLCRIFSHTAPGHKFIQSLEKNPAKLLIFTFASLITVGTLLLTLPRATVENEPVAVEDALFTATSATCVTGLIVLNTNSDENADKAKLSFSFFGQIVILLLIQLGGLGIMTFSTSAILIFGGKLSLRGQKIMQEIIDENSSSSMRAILKNNFILTFIIELAGALILSIKFYDFLGDLPEAIYYGIFHSIAAYCNAGFSLFSNNLMYFKGDVVINLTICLLIIFGGLGPMVVASYFSPKIFNFGFKKYIKRLDVHTKVVTISTLILILSGAVLFFIFDYNYTLSGLSFDEKILVSLFQSVTPRTAGFNTVDMALISRETAVILCVLMFIGGSPGGTAGGIKTSTLAIILLYLKAITRGRSEVEIYGRTIPKDTVLKAFIITVISGIICMAIFFFLLVTESNVRDLELLFETLSAFGTVGLSMGVTFKLSTVGKLLITILMFIGRCGPLTIAMAMIERKSLVDIKYPEGKIFVG
jgi:trk system potassium uptake protein TrkH